MNEHYQGARREPSSFASYGTWARTADKLVLTNSKGEKSYFRAKGDKLEMLDRNGSPIQSPLNYTLEPVKASLPTTPMAMRGMYFYMADAATFTDCATGKTRRGGEQCPAERDYAAARDRYSPGTAGGRRALYSRSEPGYRRDDENADDGSSRQIYSR